jgi:hypothetical protein
MSKMKDNIEEIMYTITKKERKNCD